MSIDQKDTRSRANPFLEAIPKTLQIETNCAVVLDPGHRESIAAAVMDRARELYGGPPFEIRAALWAAFQCAEHRIRRRELLNTLESSVSPALFASDTGLLKRIGEMVPGVLCESAGELEAAGLNNDAAELMALAACSIAETVREYQKLCLTIHLGREPLPPETPYAEALASLLKDRKVLPLGGDHAS